MSEYNTATKKQPIPPGTSFFIFSQNNRFRVFCHWLCNHSYFGNVILACIMISSAMLAAEDPLSATSYRNQFRRDIGGEDTQGVARSQTVARHQPCQGIKGRAISLND
ncbi:hypothetical protein HZH68_010791 [Vespula germanica]|uniref:Uncharacterized protein n=1 Tax=Vespula germanica TaxID=30212 RepID=A0A834JUR9_VESGE|nr:hypothetical protein HZH68_010791 [Vespula germanica]